jgi:DNA-binding MarR family transcriptional regulator/GNAT superfamily N-acetyltransferase
MANIAMEDFLEELGALALGGRLKRLADALMQDGNRIYEQVHPGFQARWFAVFSYLHKKGPTSITVLAKGLGVSHPGINKIANELIEARLVAPYRDRNDKRKRVLALTSSGRHKYQVLEPTFRDIRQAMQATIDESGGDFIEQLTALEESFGRQDFVGRFSDQQDKESGAVEIRTFKPAYAEAFRTLNMSWIEHYFKVEEADRQVLGDPAGEILSRGGEVLFAVSRGREQVIGTCALIRLENETAELAKMAVSEEAKGKQVGLLLGESVIELARARGFRTLVLESNRKLTPAISLYKKLGFIEKPIPHPSEYSRVNIYMELSL